MLNPVVIIGIGEMAGVFARGLLRLGHPVYPITRDMDLASEAATLPNPEMVLVAVAEKDLHSTLKSIPPQWRDKLTLLQNELLPRDWQEHNIENPTVISVWFEKKKGQDAKVLVPSPTFGPRAQTLVEALAKVDIPAYTVKDDAELLYELVRKNVYILTTNISGLDVGGTVSRLWNSYEALTREVADNVMDIQDWLTGQKTPRDKLIIGMLEAFDGDPDHKCMGRSAPARLERALELAKQAGLAVPRLNEIAKRHL